MSVVSWECLKMFANPPRFRSDLHSVRGQVTDAQSVEREKRGEGHTWSNDSSNLSVATLDTLVNIVSRVCKTCYDLRCGTYGDLEWRQLGIWALFCPD